MHIPDGYLSPETCAALGVAMVPVWSTAGRRVRAVAQSRSVPLLALGAAYCFLVMMFNVPIPDGTSAHAVGAVLVAVLLGPWAAVVAVSVALAIQALCFGDGGVLAFGANACNMAFVMPFVGYGTYRLAARGASLTAPRRAVAAGLGAYVGLNAAALAAAIEFGVQPLWFHAHDGTPLYAPFHLSQAVPAMLLAHLTVAGGVEAALTIGVVRYLQRANVAVLRLDERGPAEALGWRWALVGLGILAVATPLGLLASGTAFGEGPIHNGESGFWHHAILDGYGFGGGAHPVVGYLVSAAVGLALVGAVGAVARWTWRRRAPEPAAGPAPVASGGETPAWLLRPEVGLCPCGCVGTRRKGSFVAKTIEGGSALVRQALFAGEVADRPGLLQRIDPRIKLLSVLALLVGAALSRHVGVLALLYGLTLVLAVASLLPLRRFVGRVWLFVPLFTGVVVLPATSSLVTHGQVVVPLGHWFGSPVGLTRQGLTAAGLIVARVATSISLVVLLTLTTPWDRLLGALRAVGVPRVFVQVLGMAYRYVFLLLGAVGDMFVARRARTVGADRDGRAGRAYVAASAGALFGRSHELSEEVHQAMVARGYAGEVRTPATSRIRTADLAWLACCLAVAAAVVVGDRSLGR